MKRFYMGRHFKRQFWWILIPAMWGVLLTKDIISDSQMYHTILGLENTPELRGAPQK